jgi:hypothetical protein
VARRPTKGYLALVDGFSRYFFRSARVAKAGECERPET